MPVPNLPDKYNSEAVLTAADRLRGRRLPDPPSLLIFCPQPSLLRHAERRWGGRSVPGFFGETFLLQKTDGKIAVSGQFGVGGPVLGVLVEEFAAWGVTGFLLLGQAGGLQSDLQPGELVLVETAVRDEGTSHHYLPSMETVTAAPALLNRVQTALTRVDLPFRTGPTWTTDAPYRETKAELAHYAAQGVLTVEMETAALLAVAQYLGVAAAALLVVSDSLAGGVWRPAPDSKRVEKRLARAFDAVVGNLDV